MRAALGGPDVLPRAHEDPFLLEACDVAVPVPVGRQGGALVESAPKLQRVRAHSDGSDPA
jgi:hypothetical protein